MPHHRDGGVHRPDGQGVPRLSVQADRPDRDFVCPPRDRLSLFDLWDVPLPQLCHRGGGGALRGADPGGGPCGKRRYYSREPFWPQGKRTDRGPAPEFSQRAWQAVPGTGPNPGGERAGSAGAAPLCLPGTGTRAGADPNRTEDRDRLRSGGGGVSLALLVPAGGGGGPCCF